MTSYVALLRAINLAGLNRVAMPDLRAVAERLGLQEPRTLLQSGNLVFRASGSASRLERTLRRTTASELGVETDFFVRTAAEWAEILDGNPFEDEATSSPGHLVVLVCSGTPQRERLRALQAAIPGREVVRAAPRGGRHVYVVYPDGIGRSRLTMAWIEKKLDVRGTARNWNTARKIREMLRG